MSHMRQRWGGCCGVAGANAGPPWALGGRLPVGCRLEYALPGWERDRVAPRSGHGDGGQLEATRQWAAAGPPNNSTTQRAQGLARRKALRALEANQSLNYLWRPPLGVRAQKIEFLRLNQRKHTTHALQRTTGTPHRPVSLTGSSLVAFGKSPACSPAARATRSRAPKDAPRNQHRAGYRTAITARQLNF
jgi:hypothetical protein